MKVCLESSVSSAWVAITSFLSRLVPPSLPAAKHCSMAAVRCNNINFSYLQIQREFSRIKANWLKEWTSPQNFVCSVQPKAMRCATRFHCALARVVAVEFRTT